MEDLNLIPTDDLLREVSNRFEHFVFAGYASNAGKNYTRRIYKGNFVVCCGLCDTVKSIVLSDFEANRIEPKGFEEKI